MCIVGPLLQCISYRFTAKFGTVWLNMFWREMDAMQLPWRRHKMWILVSYVHISIKDLVTGTSACQQTTFYTGGSIVAMRWSISVIACMFCHLECNGRGQIQACSCAIPFVGGIAQRAWHEFTVDNNLNMILHVTLLNTSGVPRGGVWGVQTPPEIPKISVESSIAQARRTGVSISFYSSLCSHTVVIY